MSRLRAARHLARLVLAWFVLFVGVATAAPFLEGADLAGLCSASASQPAGSGDPADGLPGHGLHCPLCLPTIAPPPPLLAPAIAPAPLPPYVLQPIAAARIAALAAAPLPARGPPSFA